MSRKVIIAGNWKMNKNSAEGVALINDLKAICSSGCCCCKDADVVVCPPFTTIAAVVEATKGTNIKVGAQNIHWADNGAFTGEISGDMLKAAGVEYVIIGHSERRQYFGETDATVNARLKAALKYDLIPIVCVGELLDERENGSTEAVLTAQIRGGFDGISAEEMAKTVVAYEPVWAIGTGKTATPEIAEAAHAHIRKEIAAMFGEKVAEKVRIQYGGSMKASNARELVAEKDIDGGLIGGAALKADSFVDLIREALGK